MRKLLLVGIMIFCANLANAQDDYEVKETVIKDKEATYDNIDYLEKNFGHVQPGEIIEIKPDIQKTEEPEVVEEAEETQQTPMTPVNESAEDPSTSSKVTSSGTTRSSSARKSTSRKRSKRKKISFKRKRSKIKRKPKLGNRAACPRF